jgi:hypothetical protein
MQYLQRGDQFSSDGYYLYYPLEEELDAAT